VEAHRIVESGLDMTGSLRCRAVEVAHLDLDRFRPALK
jgi:hypothetical protein